MKKNKPEYLDGSNQGKGPPGSTSLSPGKQSQNGHFNSCSIAESDTVEQLKEKLRKADELVATLRKQYMKDINQMRNQLWLNEKYKNLNLQKSSSKYKDSKYIDVQFFDSTTGLDPTIMEALNEKLKAMRYQYDNSIMQLQDYNIKLRDQIHTFKALEKYGNVGISFFEMNASSVIQKLTLIEEEPEVIWNAFATHYHKGFFYNMIEIEFGITPETHGKLVETFDSKLNQYRIKADEKLEEMSKKSDREIMRLKQQIIQKDDELMQEKLKMENEIIKQKAIIRQAAELKLQNELAQIGKLHDTEKQEIYMEMRMIKKQQDAIEKDSIKSDARIFLMKWAYLTAIHRLKKKCGIVSQEDLTEEIENQTYNFFEKERRRLIKVNGNQISVLHDEIKQMREECNNYSEENNKLQFENYELKNTLTSRIEQIQELEMNLENAKNQLTMANKELDQYSSEYIQYKQNYEQSQQYVSCLETTNQQLKEKIEKLNKIAERFNQKTEIPDTTLSYASRGEQKAMNHFLNQSSQKSQNIYGRKNMQDQASLTVIFGLKKELETKMLEAMIQPCINKMVQTDPDGVDKEVQVDIPIYNQSITQKSDSQERTPSRENNLSRQKSINQKQKITGGTGQMTSNQVKKSDQSFTQYSAEDPSREYGKISEKDSISELSKDMKKENVDVVELSLKKKKILSEKNRKASKGYRQRLHNYEKNMKDGGDQSHVQGSNRTIIEESVQMNRIRVRKSKEKSKQNKNSGLIINTTKQDKSNLSVFNTKHMELILQKNLRLNKKTTEISTQTDMSYLNTDKVSGIGSINYQQINSERLQQQDTNGKDEKSLSHWLKKQLEKDFKNQSHLRSKYSQKTDKLHISSNFVFGDITRSQNTGKKKLSTASGRANQTTTRSSPSHQTMVENSYNVSNHGGPYTNSNPDHEKRSNKKQQFSDRNINVRVSQTFYSKPLDRNTSNRLFGAPLVMTGDQQPPSLNQKLSRNTCITSKNTTILPRESCGSKQLNQYQASLNNSFTHFSSQLQVCLTGQKIEAAGIKYDSQISKSGGLQPPGRHGIMAKVPVVLSGKKNSQNSGFDHNIISIQQRDTSDDKSGDQFVSITNEKRPMSGILTTTQLQLKTSLKKHEDIDTMKEIDSNMLLVSDGSAEVQSSKYNNNSTAQTSQKQLRTQNHVHMPINRNQSQLEKLVKKSFFKQRNDKHQDGFDTIKKFQSQKVLLPNAESSGGDHIQQSPGQFEVAPWNYQVQHAAPDSSRQHLEKPMSIKKIEMPRNVRQPSNTNSQKKNRSISQNQVLSRPIVRYLKKSDQQAMHLKQFQKMSLEKTDQTLAAAAVDENYGQDVSSQISRNLENYTRINSNK